MNTVNVDESRMNAELDAALANAPADASAPPVPAESGQPAPATAPVQSWGPFVDGLVPTMRGVVFNQWRIEEVQLVELRGSLTLCLDQAFPGGLEGKYACWARLAMCCVGIGTTNFVMNGGKLPPLGLPRVEKPVDQQAGAGEGTGAAGDTH